MRTKLFFLAVLLNSFFTTATDFYVAPNGSDSNNGTIDSPLETIQKAQELASSGDTVYIRGGEYMMREDQIARYNSIWAYVTELDKDGINYFSYQNEKPVFDYQNIKPTDKRVFAFYITGDNIHIKGIDITGVQVTITQGNTQSECFEINGGSNNIIENVNMYDNMAIGVYILRGSNNLILNCDAYRNYDSVSQNGTGGNVDGFGVHVRNGDVGNVLRGCRAWLNSDDGFDTINSGEPVLIDNCWAFYNGYSSNDGTLTNITSRGDGNGFKIGGYGKGGTSYYTILQRYAPIPRNTVQFSIAAKNKQSGFYANHHLEGNNWFNNSAFQNRRNYNMLNCKELNSQDFATDVPGWNHHLVNNLGFGASTAEIVEIDKPRCILKNNYFDLSVTVNSSDFISTDESELASSRNADGSLPSINFLKLEASSDLIDAGHKLELSEIDGIDDFNLNQNLYNYGGSAPDLGAFELGTLSVNNLFVDKKFINYPNPFNQETTIIFNLIENSKIKIAVYNLLGVKIINIPSTTYQKGKNTFVLEKGRLSSGNYLLIIENNRGERNTKIISVN
tara:strand:- start:10880 stop:12565 length:1686 start_codon:yes stop_codon:yes gene_type:complete